MHVNETLGTTVRTIIERMCNATGNACLGADEDGWDLMMSLGEVQRHALGPEFAQGSTETFDEACETIRGVLTHHEVDASIVDELKANAIDARNNG